MKKLYTLAVMCAVAVAANAQRQSFVGPVVLDMNNGSNQQTLMMPPFDTLGGPSWATGTATPALYNSSTGGYVAGTNGYGDIQKAQYFLNTNPLYVVGAMYWFGAKDNGSGNANSKIQFRVYQTDGTGTNVSGTGPCPGTVVASQDVLVSAVDTGLSLATGANVWMLTNAVPFSGDFAIGFDMSGLAAGDTVGLVSSTDLDAGGMDLSWEEWSDNTWHSFLEPNNWGLDLDLFILAIVDQNVGVNEYYNGMTMSQNYPNPAVGSTVINYNLDASADAVVLNIYDLNGNLVKSVNQGAQAPGAHMITLDVNDMAAGQYIFSLNSNGRDLTKTMTIAK